ncbi:MAG: hypothetical protein LUD29_01470 [Clostridia bacterium]|nr:hypothetical protein [Clostridia bacterium]
MDRLELLQKRKKQLVSAGENVRGDISKLIDKDSFVELSAFSFHENEFYGDKPEGEGVVTGFATVEGYPYYIVAQNFDASFGGVTKDGCAKISKTLELSAKNCTPVIYLLSSHGVEVGEGVNVLEGIASLFSMASVLKGKVRQYAVVNGELYGQISLLCAIADFTFFLDKKSYLAFTSPAVISAEIGANVDKGKVASAAALADAQIVSFLEDDLSGVKDKIVKISSLTSVRVKETEEGLLNTPTKGLNKKPCAENILKIMDAGSVIEVGSSYCGDVRCLLGRTGGIAVAAVLFDDEKGVKINHRKIRKVREFCALSASLSLPLVMFVNTLGIEESAEENSSSVYLEAAELVSALKNMPSGKISVIYGKAVGLGYTLFSAKSMGYDIVLAFAGAKVALFDDVQGAEIEFKDYETDREVLAKRYADENSDPINAAKGGYIDNIIEPAFARQYLVATLQMLEASRDI